MTFRYRNLDNFVAIWSGCDVPRMYVMRGLHSPCILQGSLGPRYLCGRVESMFLFLTVTGDTLPIMTVLPVSVSMESQEGIKAPCLRRQANSETLDFKGIRFCS